MSLRILCKTKGGHQEGMGDVVSSVSLAEEFVKHGHCVFFLINENKSVIDLISRSFPYEVAKEIPDIMRFLQDKQFDTVVLNQLNTSPQEVALFKRHTRQLVTIEDTGEGAALADMRFNVLYPIADAFIDPKFIPLSATFQNAHAMSKIIKEQVNTIMIMQGGSDTYGFIPKIIKGLYNIPSAIEINVAIGPHFAYHAALDETLAAAPRQFRLIKNNNDLSDLMLQSDLVVSAGGNSMFELACVGVPSVIVCAELFEVGTAQRMEELGVVVNLGFGEYVGEEKIFAAVDQLMQNGSLRRRMSTQGKSLVDGCGTQRMVEEIEKYCMTVS